MKIGPGGAEVRQGGKLAKNEGPMLRVQALQTEGKKIVRK